MDDLGGGQALSVLGSRIEYLDVLEAGPLHKRDIVDRLDHSRSTVDRAIANLVEVGFVERVTRGFITTSAGRLAAERYHTYLDETAAVLAARDVLEPLPADADLPMSMLTTGECQHTAGSYPLLEALADSLEDADRYRAVVPQVVDSRHIRLCRARVRTDHIEVSLVTAEDTWERLRTEFPGVIGELATAPSFDAHSAAVPAYGVLLVDGPEATDVFVVIYDDTTVHGYLRSSDPAAVAWATEAFDRLDAASKPLPTGDSADVTTLTSLLGDRLPASLREQGFARVDDRYVEDRTPLDPTVSYRVGLGLPEVFAGQSVDRYDDVGESMTDRVFDRLQTGSDVVVLGPPGSGKSTLCKRVTVAWLERDAGTVLYRERTNSDSFDATTALEGILERATDPVLVVVEDSVRQDANAVFELLDRFDGRDDVVFLLDARESEWQQPLDGVTDARLEATRQSAVETISMPPLDEAECQSLMAGLTDGADADLDLPAADLLDTVHDHTHATRTEPAAIYLLTHRLAQYADPLAAYDSLPTPTTLDEDVKRAHERLSAMGSDALDVGVLIAFLDAAGLPIETAALESLAVADVVDDDVPGAVRETLVGVALFPLEDADGFRGPHEGWAARFLEHHLDIAGAAAAHQRVASVLSAYLSLAAVPDRRAALQRRCGAGTTLLDRIVSDPSGWADDTAIRLFSVGRTYASLAPLYGSGGESALSLPAVCSGETRRRCLAARAEMLATNGDLEGARAVYERLGEQTAESDLIARVERHLGLAAVARQRGTFEAASEHTESALHLATAADDTARQARSHLEQAEIATAEGDLDRADEALDAAETVIESTAAPRLRATLLTKRGVLKRTRSNYDAATRLFEESLEFYDTVGDRAGIAMVRDYLGQVANERGDYETAREQFLRGLDRARNAGAVAAEANLLKDLGVLAYLCDEYAEAERYLEQGIPLAESLDDPSVLLPLVLNRGLIDVEGGDFDAARERTERALSLSRTIGASRYEGAALRTLTLVALEDDDPERAAEWARETLEVGRSVGATRMEIDALQLLGDALVHRGDLEEAVGHAAEAVDLAREIDNGRKLAESLVSLARAEHRFGALERAHEHAVESRDLHASADTVAEAASHRVLAAIRREQEDLTAALEHTERACTLFREDENDRDLALTLALQARIYTERGALDQARSAVETALAAAQSAALPGVRALLARSTIERERGSLEAAAETLATASRTLPDEQYPPEQLRIDIERARLAAARGDFERAIALLADCIDQSESMGAASRAASLREERASLTARAEADSPQRLQED